MTAYEEAARHIPVGEGAQVIVAGGGAGGIAAALSARRMGCTVLLIDKALLLGGLATQGLINWIEPYCDGEGHRVLGGIPWELFQLAIRDGGDSLPETWSGTGHGPRAGRREPPGRHTSPFRRTCPPSAAGCWGDAGTSGSTISGNTAGRSEICLWSALPPASPRNRAFCETSAAAACGTPLPPSPRRTGSW